MSISLEVAEEFAQLRKFSSQIGKDKRLVQTCSGNTSLKTSETLWVKASGFWLMHAEKEDIFIPLTLNPLREALAHNDRLAEDCLSFVRTLDNPRHLLPPLEAALHASFAQAVVVHVHCVNTIAIAVRQNAEIVLSEKLDGLNWAFVPYIQPGLPLAHHLYKTISPQTNIVVLGNHGLVIAAETVAEASQLLKEVTQRLQQPRRVTAITTRLRALQKFCQGTPYRVAGDPLTHDSACDPLSCQIIGGGGLYPDHVTTIGNRLAILNKNETIHALLGRKIKERQPAPLIILCPNFGVLLHKDADHSVVALARCLADVAGRIPYDTMLRYFTAEENAILLSWGTERYCEPLRNAS